MSAIVHQTDKRSGITYAYQSVSHWDKEKKQSRAKRTLIGRVDPESGEIVSTSKKTKPQTDEAKKPELFFARKNSSKLQRKFPTLPGEFLVFDF